MTRSCLTVDRTRRSFFRRVILGAADYGKWMDPAVQEPRLVLPLLAPCPDDWLTMRPVSTVVNNARNETPECLNEPAA